MAMANGTVQSKRTLSENMKKLKENFYQLEEEYKDRFYKIELNNNLQYIYIDIYTGVQYLICKSTPFDSSDISITTTVITDASGFPYIDERFIVDKDFFKKQS